LRLPVRVQIDAVSLSATIGSRISFAPAMPDIEDGLAEVQRAMAGAERGSDAYAALRLRKARIEARAARQRREALHEWTTAIVSQASEIVVARPKSVREATKSGHGDEGNWGASTALKAEFNRAVLDMAPAMVCQMFAYKAAEAGIPYSEEFHDGLDVGNAVVSARKEVRRTRRVIKKEKEITNV
jgi:putative transposase